MFQNLLDAIKARLHLDPSVTVLTGDDEDNVLDLGNGKGLADGIGGDDLLLGGNSKDVLLGRDGDDTLLGGNGNDYLRGGWGSDVMDGGRGNDVFWSMNGSNTVTTGAGSDIVRFKVGQAKMEGIASNGANGADIFSTVTDWNANDTFFFSGTKWKRGLQIEEEDGGLMVSTYRGNDIAFFEGISDEDALLDTILVGKGAGSFAFAPSIDDFV